MLTTLLTQELVSLLFLGFFALQLLHPSAVFCRRSIRLLLSFRPQNYCRGKTLTVTWLKQHYPASSRENAASARRVKQHLK